MPPGTRVLIAELSGVGRDFPLSIEKLCPVLSFYVVKDWREGCERCKQILRYGGMGHTMSIHSRNDDVILQFGLKKPAFRIVVNTPTTLGSIGLTTGLDPSMTLGCGGYGGNITSDNISPRHLLNIKRLAYETSPAPAHAAGRTDVDAPSEGPRTRRGCRADWRRSRWPGASTSFCRRVDTRRRHHPVAGVPPPGASCRRCRRPCGRHPATHGVPAPGAPGPGVSRNQPSSCAKTTFGRPFDRGARSSSASEPS